MWYLLDSSYISCWDGSLWECLASWSSTSQLSLHTAFARSLQLCMQQMNSNPYAKPDLHTSDDGVGCYGSSSFLADAPTWYSLAFSRGLEPCAWLQKSPPNLIWHKVVFSHLIHGSLCFYYAKIFATRRAARHHCRQLRAIYAVGIDLTISDRVRGWTAFLDMCAEYIHPLVIE